MFLKLFEASEKFIYAHFIALLNHSMHFVDIKPFRSRHMRCLCMSVMRLTRG